MKLIIEGATYEGSPNEIMELLESMGVKFPVNEDREDEPNLKKGDDVRALANSESNNVRVGEIGTIVGMGEEFPESVEYRIKVKIDDNFDYFRPQDLEKVVEDEQDSRLKVGDYAVITGVDATREARGAHSFEVGEVVKLTERFEGRSGGFSCQKLNGRRPSSNNVNNEDLRKATEEEVQRGKTFSKLGRAVDEFKEGDIVRTSVTIFGRQVETIGELVHEEGFLGNYLRVLAHGEVKPHIGKMELIAPVESRVDIDD